MAEQYKNYIDGEWRSAQSGKTFENRNPANRNDLIGLFPASGQPDVDDAVGAAKKAFASWRLVPAPKRGEMLYRAGELLKKNKEELARVETREMGKILKETRGDVQEGIDCAYYNAGEGRRLFGETTPSELPDKFAMSMRAPIGVGVRKSNGVPSTGAISPVGMSVPSTGVYESALIISSCPRMSLAFVPARLK